MMDVPNSPPETMQMVSHRAPSVRKWLQFGKKAISCISLSPSECVYAVEFRQSSNEKENKHSSNAQCRASGNGLCVILRGHRRRVCVLHVMCSAILRNWTHITLFIDKFAKPAFTFNFIYNWSKQMKQNTKTETKRKETVISTNR